MITFGRILFGKKTSMEENGLPVYESLGFLFPWLSSVSFFHARASGALSQTE